MGIMAVRLQKDGANERLQAGRAGKRGQLGCLIKLPGSLRMSSNAKVAWEGNRQVDER